MMNADLPCITYWHGEHWISIRKSLASSLAASELVETRRKVVGACG